MWILVKYIKKIHIAKTSKTPKNIGGPHGKSDIFFTENSQNLQSACILCCSLTVWYIYGHVYMVSCAYDDISMKHMLLTFEMCSYDVFRWWFLHFDTLKMQRKLSSCPFFIDKMLHFTCGPLVFLDVFRCFGHVLFGWPLSNTWNFLMKKCTFSYMVPWCFLHVFRCFGHVNISRLRM